MLRYRGYVWAMPLQCDRDVLKAEDVRLGYASTLQYNHATLDGIRLEHASTVRHLGMAWHGYKS